VSPAETVNRSTKNSVDDEGRGGPSPSSWPLFVAAVVIAIESAVLAAAALGLAVYQSLGHRPHDALDSWLVVGFAAFGAIALWWVWRGLRQCRRWARAPGVLVQIIAIPVAFNTYGNGVWWVATPLLVCAVLGLVGLFAPSTTKALLEH
jgi:hypothetical protein